MWAEGEALVGGLKQFPNPIFKTREDDQLPSSYYGFERDDLHAKPMPQCQKSPVRFSL